MCGVPDPMQCGLDWPARTPGPCPCPCSMPMLVEPLIMSAQSTEWVADWCWCIFADDATGDEDDDDDAGVCVCVCVCAVTGAVGGGVHTHFKWAHLRSDAAAE